jgi:hypothetical protein
MDPEIAAMFGLTGAGAAPASAAAPAKTAAPLSASERMAALLAGKTAGPAAGPAPASAAARLQAASQAAVQAAAAPENPPDAGAIGGGGAFPEVTKKLEDAPQAFFTDPEYYKTVLSNEGEAGKKIHLTLQKYLNTKDQKERAVYRQSFITLYWDFLSGLAKKAAGALPAPKKFALRFNMLHPTLLAPESRDFFARVVVNNELDQPVYYLDEWFKAIGSGALRPSTTDEVRVRKDNVQARMQQLLEKASGKLSGAKTLLKAKSSERAMLEKRLVEKMQIVLTHTPLDGLPDISEAYTEPQKFAFTEILETIRGLQRLDHDMEVYLRDLRQGEADIRTLGEKVEASEEGAAPADTGAIGDEFDTIRQMAKMCIGRQGNHFPVLMNEYFHCGPSEVATRENVVAAMAWIESRDPEAFCRSYRNQLNRIVPFVILIPCYGDTGMCWEPFDRYNRAASRARLALPMYPKSLREALLYAVGDLRWQAAKEKASYYWMEEGLTGNYYQWFTKMKMKGDLKESFIQDYITWITRESEGTQKLDKELRGAFWRYLPFAQPIKDKLRDRSYIYQELYQRDLNRAMSDGY